MPYRRLPNTDQARLRALKAALDEGSKYYPFDLAYPTKLHLDLKSFLPQFEQSVNQYNSSKDRQAQIGKQLSECFKSSKIYLSHFIQVVNFSIIRKELKPEVREEYGMDIDDKAVPELGTEAQLLQWGAKVIPAEEKRMALGGSRIYNPSIAMVKIKFEKFKECYNNHKNLLSTTQKMLEKVSELRAQADAIILNLWNSVEETYNELEPSKKREQSAKYGLVYVFRKEEKKLN